MVDIAVFRAYYRVFEKSANDSLMVTGAVNALGAAAIRRPEPYFEFPSLNCEDAIDTMRSLKPDLIFAACVSEYFGRELRAVPRLGLYVYHEGLLPEYGGLHTAYWARQNGEFDKIGYTLLRAEDKMDAGPILVQGSEGLPESLRPYWCWAGHKALLDGLPNIGSALDRLGQGTLAPVYPRDRPINHSYAGISDEIRRRVRGAKHSQRRRKARS